MRSSYTNRAMGKVRAAAWMILINTAALVLLAYAGHRRALTRLKPSSQAHSDLLPEALLHSIGIFTDAPERRNLQALATPKGKPLRVVAMGDSFTFGDEVPSGLDYPSFLRKHLDHAGIEAEVINLGNGWHGLSQTVHLYDTLVADRSPDVVLLGPEGYYLDRELTFNHAEEAYSDYVHGRFIAQAGQVQFLDVLPGPAGGYYDFPPHLRYLRHDRQAPAFMKGLLPQGRTVKNPFYASSQSPEEERAVLFPLLFAHVARGPHRTVVAYRDPVIAQLTGAAVVPLFIDQEKGALYQRPAYHYAGTGNDLVARRFCKAIAPKGCPEPHRLQLDQPQQRLPTTTIAEDSQVDLLLHGQRASSLHEVSGPLTTMKNNKMLMALGRPSMQPGYSVANGVWLRLPQVVSCAGAWVTYRTGERESIGQLTPLDTSGAIASLVLPKHWFNRGHRITAGGFSRDRLPATIDLCGTEIITLQRTNGEDALATAVQSPFVVFSPRENDWLDVSLLPQQGELQLRVGDETLPFGTWRKQ